MKVMLENVRVCFVHVFEPQRLSETSPLKYSVVILIDANDKLNQEKITTGVNSAYAEGLKKFWNNKQPSMFKHPLRKGEDKDLDKYPEFTGMYFVTASSDDKPLIVDRDKSVISDSAKFYSGCFANVLVQFYPFSKAGNNGVALGLKGAQFVADGTSFSGTVSVNEFDNLDAADFPTVAAPNIPF